MGVPAQVPLAGNVISTIISMITMAVLAVCLSTLNLRNPWPVFADILVARRLQNIQVYKNLPLATWRKTNADYT